MVICLERGADLHMAQLMPLPLTVSGFSKIQIGFTFLVLAHPGSPGQRAVKRVCMCVCEARDSEWQWHQLAICKSASCSRQITMPAPHHSVFTGRMPFLPPNQQCQSTEGSNTDTSYGLMPVCVCHKSVLVFCRNG